MKIAFLIFDGMTALDWIGVYDPLTRLKTMGFWPHLGWDLCAFTPEVREVTGIQIHPTRVAQPLVGYDLVVLPGGRGTRDLLEDSAFMEWLKTAKDCPLKASVCTGSLLLGAAGFLAGKKATTHPAEYENLKKYCRTVVEARIISDGDVITAGGVTAAIDLGLFLCERLAGGEIREKIQHQMDYPGWNATVPNQTPESTPLPDRPGTGSGRRAELHRKTNETEVEISIQIDGDGFHRIDTGIGFLDHMLTHLAVHGLFDLTIHARGDYQVDAHHTVEDVGIALGQVFSQALGDRAGMVRMASVHVPMDEALAFVAVDFSGRPYAVIDAGWQGSSLNNIPANLFTHFLESFAASARCNLHVRVPYGRDLHHQVEAVFKALARALDQAIQIDPRRAGQIPSTKGTVV